VTNFWGFSDHGEDAQTESKRGTPYKTATVNRFVTLMKRIYSLAMRDEMVEKNPCLKVSLLPERNVRDRIVSPEEFEKLKEELPQYGLIFFDRLSLADEGRRDSQFEGEAVPLF